MESSPDFILNQFDPLSIVGAITIKRDVPRGVEPSSVTRRWWKCPWSSNDASEMG